jgi:hypothetical protein
VKEVALMLVAAVVLGLVARRGQRRQPTSIRTEEEAPAPSEGRRNSFFYMVFVLLLAFSPVTGLVFSSIWSAWIPDTYNSMGFLFLSTAIGASIALPVSLGLARMAGAERYAEFWRHLERTMRRSKRQISRSMIVLVIATAAIGVALMFFRN